MDAESPPSESRPIRRGDFLANVLLFTLVSGAIGGLDSVRFEAANVFGWVVLLGLALRCRLGPFRGRERTRSLLALGLWLAAAWIWVLDPHLRPVSAALAIGLVTYRCPRGLPWKGWSWTALFAFGWFAVTDASPRLHDAQVELSRAVSGALGAPLGLDVAFGPTALALPLWITAVGLLTAWAWRTRAGRLQRIACALAVITACMALHLYLTSQYSRELLAAYVGYEAPEISAAVLAFLWSAPLFGLLAMRLPIEPAPLGWAMRPAVWAPALAAAIAVLIATAPQPESSDPIEGKVLIYDAGYLSWKTPNKQEFGKYSAGMFGLLPDRLRFNGLEVVRSTELTDESLADVDCLLAINVLESFTREQHEATWRFVEAGGSLVCLGDHTGFGAIREPFNELLEPVGIEFEFDSAKPINGDWGRGLKTFPSRLTAGLVDGERMPIGVGASLVVPFSARTLISGTRSFADAGDTSEKLRGFLGDYTYNAGEPLSDLPLVAHARKGAGQVLVFGDTSPFQNGSFSQGHLFLDNFSRMLFEEGGASRGRWASATLALLLLIGAAGAQLFGGRLLGATLCLSAVPYAAYAPWKAAEELPGSHGQGWTPAVLDLSHGQEFDLRWWQPDSLGGLTLGLFRNGIWPRVELDDLHLEGQELALIFAPNAPFEEGELERLRAFMEGGGVALCTVGKESGPSAEQFLHEFGLGLGPDPLGPAKGTAFGADVHFQCAYPIDVRPDSFQDLAFAYERPVAGLLPIGAGALLLISDNRFFQNPNLEGDEEFVPANVAFLEALLNHLRTEELL